MSQPAVIDSAELGLFGPDSVTWQLHADPAAFLGGVRSLFLQALHPRVVAGVMQNSDFRNDPLGRLERTADFIGRVTYGTVDEARAAGARIRRVHRALSATDPGTGERYGLDDPELLMWVHCTEVGSFLSVARRAGYPITKAHADRYLHEQRTSAGLVGLDPETVPSTVEQLRDYFVRAYPSLRHTPDAAEVGDFLHRPPLKGRLAMVTPLYQVAIGRLAYSLQPEWARRMWGARSYPETVTTGMLRALRAAAFAVPERFLADDGPEPAPVTAVRRLGQWAAPSPERLPRI
ncbi:oxygenase MpaB family protein [Actinokineospora guangxiensis]|uniref:Oxygenase MpaB family protein n=1 Tax=Actinokineospora guangxiensis TaxID=1490288 RepID=A0ABW0EJK0_9PSEU